MIGWPTALGLRAGELVRVRSKEEILATLDARGCLEGMPFMPEMLRHCGQRYRVVKRAEKSCDTIHTSSGRRVLDAVHLEGLRCDGSAHGGCQALCLFWWREAWLERASDDEKPGARATSVIGPGCTEEQLQRNTRIDGYIDAEVYSCQATRLPQFSHAIRWWDPRAYVREIRGGNVSAGDAVSVMAHAARNVVRRKLRKRPLPHLTGRCAETTPAGRIPGLSPGDWVQVKSQEQIELTLNAIQCNRGLYFDIEMLPYCGRCMRVLQKVDRIIDEKTGVMRRLPNDCWILEGAFCQGYESRRRLFCTRQIYPYWREIWLERVADVEAGPRS
jgi:hypothetical protein